MAMKESVNLFITDSWDTDSIVTLYRDAGWWRDEYNPDDIHGLSDQAPGSVSEFSIQLVRRSQQEG